MSQKLDKKVALTGTEEVRSSQDFRKFVLEHGAYLVAERRLTCTEGTAAKFREIVDETRWEDLPMSGMLLADGRQVWNKDLFDKWRSEILPERNGLRITGPTTRGMICLTNCVLIENFELVAHTTTNYKAPDAMALRRASITRGVTYTHQLNVASDCVHERDMRECW